MKHLRIEDINNISNAIELRKFIDCLRNDYRMNCVSWENETIDDYLGAINAWLKDSHELSGQPVVVLQLIAKILYIGKIYE